jgi:HEAT repeat protein
MTDASAFFGDLRHPDKNVRLNAAMAIGTRADVSAVEALATSLVSEGDFFVRESLVWALVRIGSPSVTAMIDQLSHPSAVTRTQAAHALSKLGDLRASPALLAALQDPSPAVVQKAAYALGTLKEQTAIAPLTVLLADASPELRNAVRDALLTIGSAVIPAVTKVLTRPDAPTDTRVAAVEVLSGLGGDEILSALATALRDTAWEVRFAAVQALSAHDGPDKVALLQPAADDTHPHVRLLAVRAIQSKRDA